MKKAKWIVPTIYIIFLMLPIYWLLNMSFKTTTEIINTYTLWPQEFTLDNYKKIFTDSTCLLYTSPSPRDRQKSRMPSSA